MTKTITAIVVVGIMMLAAGTALADTWTATFETGAGYDQTAIGTTIAGLQFATAAGGNMVYIDAATTAYNVTTGPGMIYEQGEYFIGDNVASAVLNLSDLGKVIFTLGPVSNFRMGYSSQYSFNVQAYDINGVLLDTRMGTANTRSQGGTGLSYLQITRPTADVAYVVFGNNYGGYWLVDNVTTDAPLVPEPGTLVVLGAGLVGIVVRVRGKRR